MGQRAHGVAIDMALECTKGARDRLYAIYGINPAVVYFIQRQPDGPIKIGQASRLVHRVTEFLCAAPEIPIVRAAVPGGRALEAWFHRRHDASRLDGREWFDGAELIVRDAYTFGELHAAAFRATGDFDAAAVHAVTSMDTFIADFYRLHRNGMSQRELGELAGMGPGAVRAKIESLRTMGFDIPYRRAFGSRTLRNETWAHASVPIGRRRLIG